MSTASDNAIELKGAFEGAVATAITFAAAHFAFGVGLHFLPPGVEHFVEGTTGAAADVARDVLGLPAAGPDLAGMEM